MGDPVSSSFGKSQAYFQIGKQRVKPKPSISVKQLSRTTTASEEMRKSMEGILQIKDKMLSDVLKIQSGMKSIINIFKKNNHLEAKTTTSTSQSFKAKEIKEESLVIKHLRERVMLTQYYVFKGASAIIKPINPSKAKWLDVKSIHKGFESKKIFANVTFNGRIKTHCRNIGKKYDLKEQKDLRVGKMLLQQAREKFPAFTFFSEESLPHTLTEGCCFGTTVDVLTRIKSLENLNPENFEKITEQYEDGVTPQAAANQAVMYHQSLNFAVQAENDRPRADTFLEYVFAPHLPKETVQEILKSQRNQEILEVSKERGIMFNNLRIRLLLEHLSNDSESSGISPNDALAMRSILSRENVFYAKIDPGAKEGDSLNHPLLDKYRSLKESGLEEEALFAQLTQEIDTKHAKLSLYLSDMHHYLAQFISGKGMGINSMKSEELRFYTRNINDSVFNFTEKTIYQLRGYDIHEIQGFPSAIVNNDEKILGALEKLPPGEYDLSISTESGGHSMGYVKYADGSGHIFDPNWGAIRLTEEKGDHIVQFKNLLSHYPNPLDKNPRFAKETPDHRIIIRRVERHSSALRIDS